MVTLDDLHRDAAAAIAARKALDEKLSSAQYAQLSPQHRANLLGEFPRWAHYVLSLGEPVRGALTKAQAQQSLGSARNMRAFALRLLEIADESDPVGLEPSTPTPTRAA